MKLSVGTVGDPRLLTAVDSQIGEWSATRGAELLVQKEPVNPASTAGVDVVIFPADRMGELVDARLLAVIPESEVRPAPPSQSEPATAAGKAEPADPLQFDDVVPALRDQVSKYGKERVGLPFGGSALVLIIRRDAFDREPNRAAAAKEKITLAPPRTWAGLDKLAAFLNGRDWNGDGKSDVGIVLPLGADAEGVGTATYLARAASLGQHRDQYSFLFDSDSMAPRLDSPPFVQALKDLVALKACGPPGMETLDTDGARAAFLKGDVAFLIDRAECASQWGSGKPIIVAPLPGSERVYDPSRSLWEDSAPPNRPSYLPYGGGWLVGVARSTNGRQRELALDFAKYLATPETSSQIRASHAYPMLPVRSSQIGLGLPDPVAAPAVESRPWSDAVGHTLNAERVLPGLRIPHTSEYLADLDRARAAAARGEPADSVLKKAAESWAARTRDLGLDRQLWHYRRSLNTLVTSPEPPDK
jgi:multiple sugar transport system substrate-binding protein